MRSNGDLTFISMVQKMDKVKRKHHGEDGKKPMEIKWLFKKSSKTQFSETRPLSRCGLISTEDSKDT